ncbi:MAG: hypothetical protein WBG11_07970 [Methylocella sp.]
MNQAGPFNPAFGAESFGLKGLKSIAYNLEAPRLVEDAIQRGEAMVAKGGALSAETGSIPAARLTTGSPCAMQSPTRRSGGTTTKQ